MHVQSRVVAGAVILATIGTGSLRSQATTLVLSHVNVVDVERGAVRRDVTVTIADDRIAAVDTAAPRAGAQIVDGTGKYLIPGLWDMHVHWYDERYLPLFIANGVLGVRQMYGQSMHLAWRDRIARSQLLGPRHVVGSTIVDGPNPVWPGSLVVTTAKDGQAAVARIKREGYDFIKVYNRVPREAYFGIIEEAKRAELTVEGHVPAAVGVRDATAAGQKTIEHLTGVLQGASSVEEQLKHLSGKVQFTAQTALDAAGLNALRTQRQRLLDSHDEAKAAALIAAFRAKGTWQCPTLVVLRANASLDDRTFTTDARLKYMPAEVRAGWTSQSSPLRSWKTKEDYDVDRRTLQLQLRIVGAMQRAGVNLLAGTDVLNPFAFPGFSLHDELGLLVEAGLTPAQALRTATLNPARYLGKVESQGTVDTGRIADLLLLDANPLEDIKATQKIASVIFGGRLFDRPALDRMLGDVEALANPRAPRNQALEPIPDKLVVLTFDDSKASHYTVVRPLLKKYGFGATFFITEGFTFRTNKDDYLTWEQIAELHRDGFEIGNHTGDHMAASKANLPKLKEQVDAINAQCGRHGIPAPTSFAYPGNAIDPAALPLLEQLGFRFARRGGAPEHPYEEGNGFAYEPGRDHPLLLPSAGDARPAWTVENLKRAVSQATSGRIAILQFHGAPDVEHPWVHTPRERFEAYMKYLHDEGFKAIAMRDLARYVDWRQKPADAWAIIEQRRVRK